MSIFTENEKGWTFLDDEEGIEVQFFKKMYNLCYALKGREMFQLLMGYRRFLKENKLNPKKTAWFDPAPKCRSIKQVMVPLKFTDTYEGVLATFERGEDEEANVLYTVEKDLTLGMHSADCIPLVLYGSNTLAMCHLYWFNFFDESAELLCYAEEVVKKFSADGLKKAVIGPFLRGPIIRKIDKFGREEHAFSLEELLSNLLKKYDIQAFDTCLDTGSNINLWSYSEDHNCGNQATIVTMH